MNKPLKKQIIKKEWITKANEEYLETIQDELSEILEECECPLKQITMINIAFEEIYVNICSYAYEEKEGDMQITVLLEELSQNDVPVLRLEIIFEDDGRAYNPLTKEDPDITLNAEERQIGGLGIFMTKKIFDEFQYVRENHKNKNILIKYLPLNQKNQ